MGHRRNKLFTRSMSQARIFSLDCLRKIPPVNLNWSSMGQYKNDHCEVGNIRERKVMHTKKIISHLEWKMNEAASAHKTDLVSREDLGNHTYFMTHEYST